MGIKFMNLINQRIKVRFELDPADWHGFLTENVWGVVVENTQRCDQLVVRIENSPFFVRNLSFEDVVETRGKADTGAALFHKVLKRGGHSTYMILSASNCSDDESFFSQFWTPLEELGASYESSSLFAESMGKCLYSVDIPPSVDIYKAYEFLKAGEASGVWMFQEGFVGHKIDK